MSGVLMSNLAARMDYDIALKSLAAQGVTVQPGKLTQSFLRSEAILNPGLSSFKFPLLINSANQGTVTSNTCQLLNQQDAFYITHAAFWLECWRQPGFPPEDLYKFVPFTYPSPTLSENGVVFATMGYKMWSGVLKLTVNGDVILPAWDIKRHLKVPRTQRSAFAGAWPTGQFYNSHDEFDGAIDPFYPMEPNIVLLGNKGLDLELNYPDALGNAIGNVNDYEVRGVMTFRGLLAQNVSKVA